MAFFTNSSKIGVDLNNSNATQQFDLGTIINASDGSIWQYIQAGGTVSAYAVVAITPSGTAQMAGLTALDGTTAIGQLAVAQNAFAPSEYGWVPVHGVGGPNGTFKVMCSGSMSMNVVIYIATTTGKLSNTAAASGTIAGIAIQTVNSTANQTAYACIITWPKSLTAGA